MPPPSLPSTSSSSPTSLIIAGKREEKKVHERGNKRGRRNPTTIKTRGGRERKEITELTFIPEPLKPFHLLRCLLPFVPSPLLLPSPLQPLPQDEVHHAPISLPDPRAVDQIPLQLLGDPMEGIEAVVLDQEPDFGPAVQVVGIFWDVEGGEGGGVGGKGGRGWFLLLLLLLLSLLGRER
jgi:hypothetical protein